MRKILLVISIFLIGSTAQAEENLALIHDTLEAQGLPVVTVRKSDGVITAELSPEATQEQQGMAAYIIANFHAPDLEKFRADLEADDTITAGKRLKLLQLYDLIAPQARAGAIAKVQSYWSAIKVDPDYAWLDSETANKVEVHAENNYVPLVAE